MPPFLICVHDATPAYDLETRAITRNFEPLVGRRLSFGVVPDWHGRWPLDAHPAYCDLVQSASEELLLHGYFHRRRHGVGPVSLLAEGSDEMNGLDPEDTRRTLEHGQGVFAEVFGGPARGFLAPSWQRGHVRAGPVGFRGLEHVLGFFSLDGGSGRSIPLATWTWDCGRWGWLGHLGHGLGRLLQSFDAGVPALAIHPRDLKRGYWPRIEQLTRELLDAGYEPTTPSALLRARC